MRFLFCCVLLCVGNLVFAQDLANGLVAHYSFDDCQNRGKDETGNNTNAVIQGNPNCVCGVSGNALEIDGVDDHLIFLGGVSNAFNTIDFSVSLYIKPTSGGGIQDIISKKEACTDDRAFSMSYVAGSNFVRAQLSQDEMRLTKLNAQLDFGRCWYHLVFVRRGNRSSLYVDGELVQELSLIHI